MRKLLFVFLALAVTSLSAQELSAVKSAATSKMSSTGMVEKLAADQTKSLAKTLALSDAQAEQVSGLVVKHLNSPKMQEALAKYGPEKYMGSSGTAAIQGLLFKEKSFTNGMGEILDENQMTKFKAVAKQ